MKEKVELSIITPSFNEEGNIQGVIKRISRALKGTRFEILVEDDSTDSTPQKVRKLEEKYPVRLFHRDEDKLKLGPAVLHGFAHASGKYLCVIDSDLQHPPEKIPEMLAKAKETGADVVVASRYIKGGSAEGLGGVVRKAVSIATKFLAYLVIDPSRKTSDPTAGFFLFKRELIQDIKLQPIGYKILIEVLSRANPKKVADIPYRFETRTENISKSTFKQGLLVLQHFWKLFWEVPWCGRFIKFAAVGVSGVAVNLGVTAIAKELAGFTDFESWTSGIVIATLTNFLLNNYFTWKDLKATSKKEWAKKVLLYYLMSAVSGGMNLFIDKVVSGQWGLHYLIVHSIGIVVGMLVNFFFSKLVIWKDK